MNSLIVNSLPEEFHAFPTRRLRGGGDWLAHRSPMHQLVTMNCFLSPADGLSELSIAGGRGSLQTWAPWDGRPLSGLPPGHLIPAHFSRKAWAAPGILLSGQCDQPPKAEPAACVHHAQALPVDVHVASLRGPALPRPGAMPVHAESLPHSRPA